MLAMFKYADSCSGKGSLPASPPALLMHICPQGCIKVREKRKKKKVKELTTLLRRGETTRHVNVRFWHSLSHCISSI